MAKAANVTRYEEFSPIREQAEVAARWWRNAIAGTYHDAGDAMINALSSWATKQMPVPTEGQLSEFERLMVENIMGRKEYCVRIGCDYHPDSGWASVVEAAGIRSLRVPIKTNMSLHSDGSIHVSTGYGAAWEEIRGGGR